MLELFSLNMRVHSVYRYIIFVRADYSRIISIAPDSNYADIIFVAFSFRCSIILLFIDAFKRNCFRARNKSILLRLSFLPAVRFARKYKIKPASAHLVSFAEGKNAFSFRF